MPRGWAGFAYDAETAALLRRLGERNPYADDGLTPDLIRSGRLKRRPALPAVTLR